MTPSPIRALIFMNGRNCARYVTAALESVAWQTHDAVHVLFVDDASTDETPQLARQFLQDYFPGRHTLLRNPASWGKARNAHVHLRAALQQGDFVAILDADDQLVRATVLAEMAAQYRAGFDVVWTNYVTDQGQGGHNTALDPFQSPRTQGWRTSHFFSFRSELFAAIGEEHFKDEFGDWLPAACDRAIAYPVLDQTRRYCYLPVQAYRYTTVNPESHHNQDPEAVNFSSRRQVRCADTVDAKPPLPCTRWLFGEHGAADQAALQMFQQLMAAQKAAQVASQISPQKAAPAPAAGIAAESTSDAAAWTNVAAAALAGACPALLTLATDGHAPLPPADQLWAWWAWLQHGPAQPRVLEIGAGTLAPALHAMVRALDGTVVSVGADAARVATLQARLECAGVTSDAAHLPLVQVEFEGAVGQFPDLAGLPDEASGFDLVVVSADTCGRTQGDAVLSLPMVVPRLKADAFRVCVWSPQQPRPLRDALAAWRRAAPDLVYVEHELQGRALVVQS